MKVLVTGGTGYVGKVVVPELSKDFDVYVLSRRKEGKNIIKGNLHSYRDVKQAIKGFDAVVHLAVESRHGASWKDHFLTTVKGTENVLKASVEEGVKKVVYMSSIAVKSKTKSNYAKAKKLAEEVAAKYWKHVEIPVIRASSIYDERRVALFSRIPAFPDIKTKIRFTNIYTLSEVVRTALKKGKSRIYQIGDREAVKLVDFVKACREPAKLVIFPEFSLKIIKTLTYGGKILNSFGIKNEFLPERLEYTVENKTFRNDSEVLGVKPKDTIEEVKKMKEKLTSQ